MTTLYPYRHPSSLTTHLSHTSSLSCRSIQLLPSQDLGVIGHHPPCLPIDNMCLTHDGSFLVTGSQDVCKFWSVKSIPTLPGANQSTVSCSSGAGMQDAGNGDGWSKRKKRKRKLKHRQDSAAAKASKRDSSDFFSGLCS